MERPSIPFPDVAGSAVGALAAAMASAGREVALAEIAGRTGLAFRGAFAVDLAAAWNGFDAARAFPEFLRRLGARGRTFAVRAEDAGWREARAAVDASLEAGRVVITGALFDAPEFGVVCARVGNDHEVAGRASGGVAGARRSLESFAMDRPLLLGVLDGTPLAAPLADAEALALALRVLDGADDFGIAERTDRATLTGPAALDAWRQALERGPLDFAGHAVLLASTAQARAWGAAFLTDAAERAIDGPHPDAAAPLVDAANECDAAAQLYAGIDREIFREAGDLERAERRATAAGMLASAQRREDAARSALREALAAFSR